MVVLSLHNMLYYMRSLRVILHLIVILQVKKALLHIMLLQRFFKIEVQNHCVVNSRFTCDLSKASPKTRPIRSAQALHLFSSGKRAKAFTNLQKLTRCLLPTVT
jgi:hypothetical protein